MRRGPGTAAILMAVAPLLGSCGGDDARPSTPTPVVRPSSMPAGATLTLVSAETGAPTSGATLTINGRTYNTGVGGSVILNEDVSPGAVIEITAPGFLTRRTGVRDNNLERRRLTLLPTSSPTGLNQHTLVELLYTYGANCCPGDGQLGAGRLLRVAPTATTMSVSLSARYQQFPHVVRAIQDAIDITNAAQTSVRLGYTELTGSVRVDVDYAAGENTCAYFDGTYGNSGATSAAIMLGRDCERIMVDSGRDPYVTGLVGVFVHELGHLIGLQHSTDPGVMSVRDRRNTNFVYFRATRDFSAVEKLLMQFIYERPYGTRFPDDDLRASSAGRGRQRLCELGP